MLPYRYKLDRDPYHYATDLYLTGRDEQTIALVRDYSKVQGLWRNDTDPDPIYTDTVTLDLSSVEASLAGPKRPQDRVSLATLKPTFDKFVGSMDRSGELTETFPVEDESYHLHHGAIVIAAITSCTNTSNPSVLMAAGLLAKNAIEKGMKCKPWVKTSFAPGSKVVTDYLVRSGLQPYFNDLGFDLVGYGCTTCIGNSGPLPTPIAKTIEKHDLVVSSVLSGNRNFEGRIHQQVKANWLASPPLVVAYALAGTARIDLTSDPLGEDSNGNPVYLRDIWPSNHDIAQAVTIVNAKMFHNEYANVFTGDENWLNLPTPSSNTYEWDTKSTYIQHPPFFQDLTLSPPKASNIEGARLLALLGDSITTDHISPAGAIKSDGPAGEYLKTHAISVHDFNSFGSRRGNHDVMMRGTFANIRIQNLMVPGSEGGVSKHFPSNQIMSIYDTAMAYQKENIPLVVIAGKEYGTGSSRDWAAKGTRLLGVKAVIAESYERIHRSNLIGMGVLPLEFINDINRETLQLTGEERIDITGIEDGFTPKALVGVRVTYPDDRVESFEALVRIDTNNELTYYQNDGILHYVLRDMLNQ